MKRKHLVLLLLVAPLLSACAVYDTVARTVGLPESTRPNAMRAGAEPSDTNIYDVEINDSTLDYLAKRRASR